MNMRYEFTLNCNSSLASCLWGFDSNNRELLAYVCALVCFREYHNKPHAALNLHGVVKEVKTCAV